MSFASPSGGWLTGPFEIRQTRDGGRTWKDHFVPGRPTWGRPSAPAEAFCAIPRLWTDMVEYVLTRDGGETWQSRQIAHRPRTPVYDLSFLDPSHGWLLTGTGPNHPVSQCFRTADGGETWDACDTLVGEPHRVLFRNPEDGWLIAKGERTGEARYTFTIDTGTGTKTAFLGGERNWICRSSDGGRSWVPVSWLDHDLTDLALEPAPSRRIFVSGFDGLLLLSTDEGERWQTLNTGFEGEICRPAFKDKTIVAPGGVPGAGAIIVSLDGGATWTVFPLDDVPFAAHLCDDRSGVVAACAGVYRFELSG